MMIGDLIKIVTSDQGLNDDRTHGTVLRFDIYSSTGRNYPTGIGGVDMLRPTGSTERIVEVLWNTGSVGWILKSRIDQV